MRPDSRVNRAAEPVSLARLPLGLLRHMRLTAGGLESPALVPMTRCALTAPEGYFAVSVGGLSCLFLLFVCFSHLDVDLLVIISRTETEPIKLYVYKNIYKEREREKNTLAGNSIDLTENEIWDGKLTFESASKSALELVFEGVSTRSDSIAAYRVTKAISAPAAWEKLREPPRSF